MLTAKPLPPSSLELVGRPDADHEYRHFERADQVRFDARTIGFSPGNAWWLAEASLLTYWPAAEASQIFRDAAGLESELIEAGGAACHVAWNRTSAIVAFRGTQPGLPLDVWTCFDAALTPWIRDGERVHGGCRNAVRERLVARIGRRLKALPGRTIWITGHGLGAALATLLADRLGDAAGLYTFGSPRVGDAAFARGFSRRHAGRSFRYVNHRDVVAEAPRGRGFDGAFAHVEHEMLIDRDGCVADAAGLSRLADAMPGVAAGERALGATQTLVGPVTDHAPRRYAVCAWNALVNAMAEDEASVAVKLAR